MKVPSVGAPPNRREAGDAAPPGVASPRGPLAYPGCLWRGDIPLERVFWRDMVAVGTAVNLMAMGLAFLAVALGASTAAGIAIFMAPLPYNIFLVTSVWRRADIEGGEWAWPARIGALVWLVVAFLI